MDNPYGRARMSVLLPWKPRLAATELTEDGWRLTVDLAGDPGAGSIAVRLRNRRTGREQAFLPAEDETGGDHQHHVMLPLAEQDDALPAGRYDVRVSVEGSQGLQDQRLEVPVDVMSQVAAAHMRIGARRLTPYATGSGGLALAIGSRRLPAHHRLRLEMVRTVAVRDRAARTVRVRLDLPQVAAGTRGHRLRLTDHDRVVTVPGAVDEQGVFEAAVKERVVSDGLWTLAVHVRGHRPWLEVGGSVFVRPGRPVAVLYGPAAEPDSVPVQAWEPDRRAGNDPSVRAALGQAAVGAGRSVLRALPARLRRPARRAARALARAARPN